MDLVSLHEGNRIARQLTKWNNILTRLNCGGESFFHLKFIGEKNKTMDEVEDYITDKRVIEAYIKFVVDQIKKYESELAKL